MSKGSWDPPASMAEVAPQTGVTTPGFVMHGAREILTYTADAVHIERQIKAIENAVFGDPSMAFDLSRVLVEGACKTILRDRGHSVLDHPKLPAWFWETLTKLQIV